MYFHCSVKPFSGQPPYAMSNKAGTGVSSVDLISSGTTAPPWEGRAIATHKLRLVEFSAFLEQQRDPDTVSAQ